MSAVIKNEAKSRANLRVRIDALPRVSLAHLPTPLEPCPRLSAALDGPQIWVKRDDMTGLAFGGNKTRQLEFVFGELVKQGCDSVVAGAYTQSNWCRQMTAAAARLGLDIWLVLVHGEKGPKLQGNLLLDRLMGADVTIVDVDSLEQLQPHLDAKFAELRARGRKPFMVAPFARDELALGAVGYVDAALELDAQFAAAGIDPSHIYLAGANMTPAGLAIGLKALGRRARVVSISPIIWSTPRDEDIADIANAAARRLGIDAALVADEIDVHDEFVGPRYGVLTDGAREALRLAGRTEGLILDPVYSSKAMAGLIAHVRDGRLGRDDLAVFVHTGGTPALFAYAEDLGLDVA